ncbi:MAG: amino acid deaminase/aldolase [Candidatus Sericytochromatia bacterium]
MPANWKDWRDLLAGYRLPCAFVDLDALDANLQEVLQQSGHLPVRLASKSIRCRWLFDYLLKAHPRIQGLMCFTAAEALWLSQQGYHNLLVGYPSWDATAVRGICQALRSRQDITLMLDSSEQGRWLNTLAEEAGVQVPVCIDLDLSNDWPGLHFGVWRSPLQTVAQLENLLFHLRQLPHLRIVGLMGYEAQLAGVGDNLPGQQLKNRVVQILQRCARPAVRARRQAAVQALRQAGVQLELVNGGGSGSLSWTAEDSSVTELTAGSAFFAPTLFDAYRHLHLQPAAGFALPIVRQPAPQIYTCLGGGYIASGAIGPEKAPSVWLPEGASLTDLEGAGEVQTPLLYRGTEALQGGDPVLFRHAKAGELCERFSQLHLVRGGRIVESVNTYRGEGQCFL